MARASGPVDFLSGTRAASFGPDSARFLSLQDRRYGEHCWALSPVQIAAMKRELLVTLAALCASALAEPIGEG